MRRDARVTPERVYSESLDSLLGGRQSSREMYDECAHVTRRFLSQLRGTQVPPAYSAVHVRLTAALETYLDLMNRLTIAMTEGDYAEVVRLTELANALGDEFGEVRRVIAPSASSA